MIEKIVSGGQTGVDRGALDAALQCGVPCGGWCPRGRLAEDGRIPARYPLDETPGAEYAERTRANVRDSDGTLVLCAGPPAGGTAYTIACCRLEGRPWLALDLRDAPPAERALAWVRAHGLRTLNVAGPRESTAPGVRDLAYAFVETLLRRGAP